MIPLLLYSLPKRMREPFGEEGVAALGAVVFYGGLEGRLGTEEDDEGFRTRDGGVALLLPQALW